MAFKTNVTMVDTGVIDDAAQSLHKTHQSLKDSASIMANQANNVRNAICCPGCEELFEALDKMAANMNVVAEDTELLANEFDAASERVKKVDQDMKAAAGNGQ